MDGHAQKAKELLDQANRELKAAAEAANPITTKSHAFQSRPYSRSAAASLAA